MRVSVSWGRSAARRSASASCAVAAAGMHRTACALASFTFPASLAVTCRMAARDASAVSCRSVS